MSISRRVFLGGGAAALGTLAPAIAWSQAERMETARIINGFPPGTTPDVISRKVGDKIMGRYAKTVIVENRTGAGGQLAVSEVKKAVADGSSILLTPMSMLGVYPFTYKKLPYDPVADLAPVSMGSTFDYGIAVGPAVPESVKSIPELMEWYKANPSKANISSSAAGSPLHFVGLMMGRAAGVELTHVAYRGTPPAINDMLGGSMPALCGPLGTFLPLMGAGKIRLLASSGAQRSRFTPHVATLAEQGYKDLVFSEWYGFYAPAKTPSDTIQRLNRELQQALLSKDVVDTLATVGMEAAPSTPEQLASTLKRDLATWGPIVKAIGFTAEN